MDAALIQWASGLTTGLSQIAASAFVSGIWQGLVLAVAAWACLRMVPKTTAAIRFTVWTAVFSVLAILPFLHAYTGRTEQVLATHGTMLRLDVRWSFAIAGLWAVLSAVRASRLLMSGFRLHGIWKRATVVKTPSFAAGLRGARLCTSRDVDRPSVIGFFSPRILLPEDLFYKLTTPELEQIVLHELGHLRRRDDWINLAQKIGLVLFPLNPALAWVERKLCSEREMACDDEVLRLTRAPKAYARCLTNLAEQRLAREFTALSLGAWEHRSELGRRVHSILRGGAVMGRVQSRVVLGVLVLALAGGATELARCPKIVSFTNAVPSVLPAAPMQAARYHPVAASEPGTAEQGRAHETLLKESMPAAAMPVVHRKARHNSGPILQRVKKVQPTPRIVEQWVVMTSWTSSQAAGSTRVSRMVFTVPGEIQAVPAYAAVPTFDGWLVLQL